MRFAVASIVTSLVIAVAACGGKNSSGPPDASPPDAMASGFCGDNKVEPPEQCDNGTKTTDVTCDENCRFTCGNGTVDTSVGETCDTGITSGTGSCPTTCDDGNACTTDVLSGSACTAMCINTPITATVNGDGCCPSGANANTDTDCAAMCGNGVVEPGEVCDTGIASGPGSCPTSCDDGVACTTDTLANPGTCMAACSHTTITMPKNGDGCCPAGATHATDTDCPASCGDGVVEAGETCDTAIKTGAGSCPTTCNDGIACTKDALVSGGTCQAVCTFTPITMPINNDMCCPAGANANDDNDCKPVCGNGVVEAGEQCDDGNTVNGDGCSSTCQKEIVATAFRFSDLFLRDPHVFVNFIGCRDVTDTQLAGFSVNNSLHTSITTDGSDPDTFLDLSIVLVFRPLGQSAATSPMEIHFADCTSPIATTSCTTGKGQTIPTTATNMSGGQCLAALAGTTHPYTPAITNATAPCFVTNPVTVTINLGGIPITLHDARVAATYVGSPATSLTNGLLMGFISQTDAENTTIPTTFPLVGGMPLSALLAGGMNACPTYSDMDMDGTTPGWWFYLNFPASKVPWTD
jgi:cysteine-rich repeat protein